MVCVVRRDLVHVNGRCVAQLTSPKLTCAGTHRHDTLSLKFAWSARVRTGKFHIGRVVRCAFGIQDGTRSGASVQNTRTLTQLPCAVARDDSNVIPTSITVQYRVTRVRILFLLVCRNVSRMRRVQEEGSHPTTNAKAEPALNSTREKNILSFIQRKVQQAN